MIWLIGNKGMLGTELSLFLEQSGIPFVGTDREIDICNPAALSDFIREQEENNHPIDRIINCAAYTAVDKAEDDAETCCLLNSAGAGNIAQEANKTGAGLVHVSTDYVFDGSSKQPYAEEDETNPIGIYGRSKRDGEIKVLEENPKSYIIRTAWLYGKYGNNFVHTMLTMMNERSEVKVVDDQRGSPTWTFDLASVIVTLLVKSGSEKPAPFGIYNYTNEGDITWFDFANEIYRQGRELGCVMNECMILPCTSADFPSKVKRPLYSVLDKSKIINTLEIDIPAWDASLRKFLSGII